MAVKNNNFKEDEITPKSIYKHWRVHAISSNVFNVVAGLAVYFIGFGSLKPSAGNIIITIGILAIFVTVILLKAYRKFEQHIKVNNASIEEKRELESKLARGTLSADLLFYVGLMHFLTTRTLFVFIALFLTTLTFHILLKPSFNYQDKN